MFLEHGECFVGYQEDFYWSDIGTLAAYRRAQYDVLSGKVGVKIPGERSEGLWVREDRPRSLLSRDRATS